MSDTESKPIHIVRLPIGWIIITVFLAGVILNFLGARSPISVIETADGIEYRATSHFYFNATAIAFSAITGCLGFLYLNQKSLFRGIGFALIGISAWLAYTGLTLDTSNHRVLITPTRILDECGTRREPVIRQIDLSKTAFIRIVEDTRNRERNYELVANAASDGQETQIPINDLMRAALPKIVDYIAQQNIAIGESDSGGLVPLRLQQMINLKR